VIQFAPLLAKTFSRRPNLRLPAAAHTRRRLAQDKTRQDKTRLSYRDLNLRPSAAVNTRQPQNTTAAAYKTFLQRFQNLLPVGYMTMPKDSLPASTFLKASRRFQRWITLPRARTISCLHVTKNYQNVLFGAHTPKCMEFPSPLQVTRSFYRRSFTSPSKGS
jgi:hypothetical protein